MNTHSESEPMVSVTTPRLFSTRIIFIVLALIAPLICMSFVKIQQPQLERDALLNLSTIVQLKSDQIENWLGERTGDSKVIQSSAGLSGQIQKLIQDKSDKKTVQEISIFFKNILRSYGYEALLLLDSHNQLILSVGKELTVSPVGHHLANLSINSKKIERSELFQDKAGDISLNWAVPIIVSDAKGERVVAIILMRATANQFLFPLIQSWPSASDSAEVLLVRRDGENLLYLNELRHRKGAAMNMRLPLNTPNLPAAIAINAAKSGTTQGEDYRGMEVFSAYHPIAGTDWHIVSKIDRDEVLAPMWRTLYWVAFISIAATIFLMLALTMVFHQQRRTRQLEILQASDQATAQYTRSLIEASLDPLVTIGMDGKITDVNAATERVTGATRELMIGSDFANYFTDPEKASIGYQQVFSQGSVTDYPLTIRHVSGNTTDVLYNASVYRNGMGEVVGVFAAARDITELKQAEELLKASEARFKTIFMEAPLGIALIDSLTGKIYAVNSMFAKIAGRTIEEMEHIDWMMITHPDDIQKDLDNMALLNAGKISGFQMEKRYLHPDGTIVWISMTIAPVHVEDKLHLRHLAMIEDITENKRTEAELEQYRHHLEELVEARTGELVTARNAAETANRAKSTFLSSMSHELRTPLNAILGFSNLMRRDAQLRPDQRDNLDIINRSGEHLLTLINDVLEVTKIEAGKIQLNNRTFDLGLLVRDVTDLMELRANEKGLFLRLDQSSNFPRYINADEAHLRQILINLLGNAVKFTHQGGVTLRLATKPNTIAHLIIEIEDTGIGLSAADQQRLFQPFVQLGKQPGDNQGTGLGLSITRQFVQLMGGSITVESTPGKGSLFRVELPLIEAKETDLVLPQEAGKREIVGVAPGQARYRILIVEDDPENQLLLSRLMQHIGFEIKVAADGVQGIQLFQSWQPHLIWMDRRMPLMDGLEATQAIRQLPGGKDVKIIAVTAAALEEERDEMMEAGMDDFVRKPYRFNEIYDSLGKQLSVQYSYAEPQPENNPTAVILTTDMLAVLPPELRNELRAALESLREEQINAALHQVAAYDVTLYHELSRLVDNFDYPSILKVLPGA